MGILYNDPLTTIKAFLYCQEHLLAFSCYHDYNNSTIMMVVLFDFTMRISNHDSILIANHYYL